MKNEFLLDEFFFIVIAQINLYIHIIYVFLSISALI